MIFALGLALGLLVAAVASLLDARQQLAAERERVSDLLSRLAARTHGEYAAFAVPQPTPVEESAWRYDPTGLIGVEDDDG